MRTPVASVIAVVCLLITIWFVDDAEKANYFLALIGLLLVEIMDILSDIREKMYGFNSSNNYGLKRERAVIK